jgi:hypothetical protein
MVAFGIAGAIASSASATSVTIVLPASNAGDMLVAIVAIGSTASILSGSSARWVAVGGGTLGGAAQNTEMFFAISTGSDANPMFDWIGATRVTGQVVAYTGTGASPIGGAASGNGTADPHTCGSYTLKAGRSLGTAIDIQNSSTAQTATPTGWVLDFLSPDATGGFSFAGYSKQMGAAGSSSGSLSTTTGAFNWRLRQQELMGPPLQTPARKMIGWY